MIKITPTGGLFLLNCLFNGTTLPSSLVFQLCVAADLVTTSIGDSFLAAGSDTFYAAGDLSGNYLLAEAHGGGYASVTIDASINNVMLVSGIPTAEWSSLSFEFNGPVNGGAAIRGYHIVSGTDVLFEGVLTTPFTVPAKGGNIRITPRVQLGNGTPG